MAKSAKKAAKKAVAKKKPVKSKPKKSVKVATASGDKQRFTLHGTMTSGPSYTVGLMLSLCRHPFSYIHINLREGQHKQPDYLVKNRYGQVPALRDGQLFLVQSAAILEHLSSPSISLMARLRLKKSGCANGFSGSGTSFPCHCCVCGPAIAAFASSAMKSAPCMTPKPRRRWRSWNTNWRSPNGLLARKPTIADIGIFAIVRYAPEAMIDLTPYPNIVRMEKTY